MEFSVPWCWTLIFWSQKLSNPHCPSLGSNYCSSKYVLGLMFQLLCRDSLLVISCGYIQIVGTSQAAFHSDTTFSENKPA